MFQSGLIASDEENVYYLALDNTSYNFHLIKENKISKEKTTLTDAAGGSLNVTKDWIYFVDVENGYVKRISKDGQTIEPVLDTGASVPLGARKHHVLHQGGLRQSGQTAGRTMSDSGRTGTDENIPPSL